MLRSLYKRLVSWHPSRFRDRFGAEMLSIFDHVDGSKARAVLVADGFLSLLRQWSIRSQFEAEEVLGVPGEGIPAFGTLPSTRLRARLLIDGLILATVVFCLVCLAFQYNWTHPVLIRFTGVQFADETDAEPAGSSSILPVDEALPGQPERQTVTEHSVNQVRTGRASSVATVSKSLLAIFDRYPLLALGEWHDSQGDRELRTDLLHQAGFADKVQNIVLECGNALYQDALDRYVDGEDVPREQIQKVWRDTTQSPVAPETYLSACESFINEARSINRDRNAGKKIRLLAGDPPIDWTKVKTTQTSFRSYKPATASQQNSSSERS